MVGNTVYINSFQTAHLFHTICSCSATMCRSLLSAHSSPALAKSPFRHARAKRTSRRTYERAFEVSAVAHTHI